MVTQHTLKTFDEDLANLRGVIKSLGDVVSEQLTKSISSLLQGDRRLAEAVIEQDVTADALASRAHAEVVRIIARYQAVACDLREIVAAERLASNLERIGDHAKNIAKRCIALGQRPSGAVSELLSRFGDGVRGNVTAVLEAYARRDAALAEAVWRSDETFDEQYDDLFHRLLSGMQDGQEPIAVGMHLVLAGKSLERIGDHATNIAEEVCFMVTGSVLQRRVSSLSQADRAAT